MALQYDPYALYINPMFDAPNVAGGGPPPVPTSSTPPTPTLPTPAPTPTPAQDTGSRGGRMAMGILGSLLQQSPFTAGIYNAMRAGELAARAGEPQPKDGPGLWSAFLGFGGSPGLGYKNGEKDAGKQNQAAAVQADALSRAIAERKKKSTPLTPLPVAQGVQR